MHRTMSCQSAVPMNRAVLNTLMIGTAVRPMNGQAGFLRRRLAMKDASDGALDHVLGRIEIPDLTDPIRCIVPIEPLLAAGHIRIGQQNDGLNLCSAELVGSGQRDIPPMA